MSWDCTFMTVIIFFLVQLQTKNSSGTQLKPQMHSLKSNNDTKFL